MHRTLWIHFCPLWDWSLIHIDFNATREIDCVFFSIKRTISLSVIFVSFNCSIAAFKLLLVNLDFSSFKKSSQVSCTECSRVMSIHFTPWTQGNPRCRWPDTCTFANCSSKIRTLMRGYSPFLGTDCPPLGSRYKASFTSLAVPTPDISSLGTDKVFERNPGHWFCNLPQNWPTAEHCHQSRLDPLNRVAFIHETMTNQTGITWVNIREVNSNIPETASMLAYGSAISDTELHAYFFLFCSH